MSVPRTAGLVLAAGASARLGGTPKFLLSLGEATILETVLAAAREAGLDPLVLVVGPDGRLVRRALAGSRHAPDRIVDNANPSRGISSSVAVGVANVMAMDVDAVAVLLADEPFVGVAAIRTVVQEWQRMGSAAARPMYSDRPGHPVVLGRSVFPLVARLRGPEGVLSELTEAGHEVTVVQVDSQAPLDVDTEDDYEQLLRRPERPGSGSSGMSRAAGAPPGSPRR